MSSATGGILTLTNPTLPSGVSLSRTLQTFLRLVTALDGKLVREAFQPDAPPLPSKSTDWLSFYLRDNSKDFDSIAKLNSAGTSASVTRHQTLELVLNFYGPNSYAKASNFVDAITLGQNRYYLRQNFMNVLSVGSITRVPQLRTENWVDQHTVALRLSMRETRSADILSQQSASGTVGAQQQSDEILETSFSIEQE